MTSLKESVQELLQNFVQSQEASGAHIAVDILRVLQEESQLLYETQCLRDLLDQDPFQCYKDDAKLQRVIQKFQQCLRVTSCHRLERSDDYCLNQAVVCYGSYSANTRQANSSNNASTSSKHEQQKMSPLHKKQKRQSPTGSSKNGDDPIQLHFRYERDPATEHTATSIWYSIDLSKGYGPKQNIVTIRVWADGNKPSRLPAISIDNNDEQDSDDDDWEDIDDEGENDDKGDVNGQTNSELKTKEIPTERKTRNPTIPNTKENDDVNSVAEDERQSRDRYACFVDPEMLHSFQECTRLESLDEATAFFTLMTFPFYQHEWDLVGFVLESVFG